MVAYKEYYVGARMVGVLSKGVYTTIRNSTVHYYRLGKGYPISNQKLKEVKGDGGHTVHIVEQRKDGTERVYEASIQAYLDAVIIEEPPYEKQNCLPLKQMKDITGGR